MPQPTPYERLYSLTGYAEDNPANPYNAAQHDAEFDAVQENLGGLNTNIALIQRDDGALKNGVVTPRSLSTATLSMIANWNVRGTWAAFTDYAVNDFVEFDDVGYLCLTAHTSTVFATQLALGYWLSIDVSMAALANPADGFGDDMIASLPDASGSGYLSVRNRLSYRKVIMDKIPKSLWASIEDGTNTTDLTPYWTDALDARPYRLIVPAGTHIIDSVGLLTNLELEGDGEGSIIKQKSGASYAFQCDSGSASVSDNIKNLVLRDLQLLGTVATDGFSEFKHLLAINGVSDVLLDNVTFRGFRGDGLYLGSSNTGGLERHNERITIRKSRFDGVNNDNRNGISVIDCNGLLIDDSNFINCTRPGMPGAIDIEPDSNVYHIIRNIKITRNTFKGNGGGNGSISFYLPDVAYTTQPSTFRVSDNVIEAVNVNDVGIRFQHIGNVAAARNHDLNIFRNRLISTGNGISVLGVANATVEENTIDTTVGSPTIGLASANQPAKCRQVIYFNNTFKNIGNDNSLGGQGIQIFDVDYLEMVRNKFVDCGKANGTLGYGMFFNAGASSYVSLMDNTFLNPGSRTTICVKKDATHTFSAATNRMFGTQLIGATGNEFVAEDSDQYETSYSPIVVGASAAGTGAYNTQFGRYKRVGKLVSYCIFVDVQAGHTGTGLILLSLPLDAKSESAQLTLSPALASGLAASSQTFVGRINTAAVANGITGAVRIFRSDGNVINQVSIPAGAFTIEVSGSYLAA